MRATQAGFWRVPPEPRLAHLVAEVSWSRDDVAGFAATAFRVLPDGRMDLVVARDLDGGATRVDLVGTKTPPLLVADEVPREKLLFALRPGAAPRLFGVGAAELRDRSLPLDALGPAARALCRRLADAPFAATGGIVAAALGAADLRASEREAGGRRALVAALREIASEVEHAPGPPRVREIARRTGIGERRLERLFADRVGIGPKAFARILRFRRALALLQRGTPHAEAALACGYSDQAHMVREFRSLAGLSPGALLHGAFASVGVLA